MTKRFFTGAILLTSFCFLVAAQSNSCGNKSCPQYERRHYELHYGFVDELLHSQPDDPITVEAVLIPSYAGTQCSGPFCATLHLVSELLWEQADPNSEQSPESCSAPSGSHHLYLRWQGQAGTQGDAWDGLSFVFAYPPGDAAGSSLYFDVRVLQSGVEIFRQIETFTALQLKNAFPQVWQNGGPQPPSRTPVTAEGHALEFGSHFSLAYRLYDILLLWGYGSFEHVEEAHTEDCQNPSWPMGVPGLVNWNGRLSLSEGMIHPVRALYFERPDQGDQVTDCQGNLLPAGQLVNELCFRSVAEEILEPRDSNPNDGIPGEFDFGDQHYVHGGNAEALQVNLVVPTASVVSAPGGVIFSTHVEADGYVIIDGDVPVAQDPNTGESLGGYYPLPWRWTDADALFRCPDTSHVAHAHQHWCWYKHEF